MGGHGEAGGSGVASGMRRRPIDTSKKLPLIRSTKELALDDDTRVDGEVSPARRVGPPNSPDFGAANSQAIARIYVREISKVKA